MSILKAKLNSLTFKKLLRFYHMKNQKFTMIITVCIEVVALQKQIQAHPVVVKAARKTRIRVIENQKTMTIRIHLITISKVEITIMKNKNRRNKMKNKVQNMKMLMKTSPLINNLDSTLLQNRTKIIKVTTSDIVNLNKISKIILKIFIRDNRKSHFGIKNSSVDNDKRSHLNS